LIAPWGVDVSGYAIDEKKKAPEGPEASKWSG